MKIKNNKILLIILLVAAFALLVAGVATSLNEDTPNNSIEYSADDDDWTNNY